MTTNFGWALVDQTNDFADFKMGRCSYSRILSFAWCFRTRAEARAFKKKQGKKSTIVCSSSHDVTKLSGPYKIAANVTATFDRKRHTSLYLCNDRSTITTCLYTRSNILNHEWVDDRRNRIMQVRKVKNYFPESYVMWSKYK